MKPWNGKVEMAAGATRGLSDEYSYTDADGNRPQWGRYAEEQSFYKKAGANTYSWVRDFARLCRYHSLNWVNRRS
jgi:hypothetical protein